MSMCDAIIMKQDCIKSPNLLSNCDFVDVTALEHMVVKNAEQI